MELDLEQMKDLIELFEDSGLTEISVSQDDYEVTLKKNSGGEARSASRERKVNRVVESEDQETSTEVEGKESGTGGEERTGEEQEGVFITSPIVGKFYRSPSPSDAAYVQVGDEVEEGDTVCIVEAMKVMNEVKADRAGEVVEIHAEDGDPVEYGQKLMTLIPPDEAR